MEDQNRMNRKTFAIYTLIIGGLVGVIGDVLFYGKTLGVSFPLFIVIGIAVMLASVGLTRQPLRLRNLWILAPALFFAGMVAVRADGGINLLNVMASLALGALALYYLPLSRRIDLSTVGEQVTSVLDASLSTVVAPILELIDSVGWLFDRMQGNWRTVGAIARGLLFTAPVVLVFALLFSAADAVFAGYMDSLAGFLRFPLAYEHITHITTIAVIGWLACGAVAYGAARRESFQRKENADRPKRKLPALGMIEGCIMLGSVDLLFALFVIIQFTYFFGGHAGLAVSDLSYAEYARRGFFELVAVSVLTLALVLALDSTTVRRAQRHTTIFRVLVILLVGLVGVILVSASQRMLLYEARFGFTTLRVYTHVFMYWLAALFAFFLLALFRIRQRIFSLGVLLVMIGYLGTLNLMNVEQYIAERNIARAAEGYELDSYYLSGFSVDALPAILAAYQSPGTPPEAHAYAGQWLSAKLNQLEILRQYSGSTVFSANLSRDSAWAALNAIRETLPEYEPRYFYREW